MILEWNKNTSSGDKGNFKVQIVSGSGGKYEAFVNEESISIFGNINGAKAGCQRVENGGTRSTTPRGSRPYVAKEHTLRPHNVQTLSAEDNQALTVALHDWESMSTLNERMPRLKPDSHQILNQRAMVLGLIASNNGLIPMLRWANADSEEMIKGTDKFKLLLGDRTVGVAYNRYNYGITWWVNLGICGRNSYWTKDTKCETIEEAMVLASNIAYKIIREILLEIQ